MTRNPLFSIFLIGSGVIGLSTRPQYMILTHSGLLPYVGVYTTLWLIWSRLYRHSPISNWLIWS